MLETYLKTRFDALDMNNSLIARKLEISRNTVHNWMNGTTLPSFVNCCQIADLLAIKTGASKLLILSEMIDAVTRSTKTLSNDEQ